jgi:hypothetical protein
MFGFRMGAADADRQRFTFRVHGNSRGHRSFLTSGVLNSIPENENGTGLAALCHSPPFSFKRK